MRPLFPGTALPGCLAGCRTGFWRHPDHQSHGGVAESAPGGHGGHGGGDEEDALPKLEAADEATVRDAIVRVLSNQSYEQLRQDKGHSNVKDELRNALDDVFARSEVVDVLFLSFVMQ